MKNALSLCTISGSIYKGKGGGGCHGFKKHPQYKRGLRVPSDSCKVNILLHERLMALLHQFAILKAADRAGKYFREEEPTTNFLKWIAALKVEHLQKQQM